MNEIKFERPKNKNSIIYRAKTVVDRSDDVVVENDLDVTQRLRVQGSRVINITELKAIVAASTDFAAFKTAIAGLV